MTSHLQQWMARAASCVTPRIHTPLEANPGSRLTELETVVTIFSKGQSGAQRSSTPMTNDNRPRTMEVAHWGPVSQTTEKAWPPTKTMRICAPIIAELTAMNSQLLSAPSKMFRVLSYCRQLRMVPMCQLYTAP